MLPVVLSRAEVRAVLEELPGQYRLMGQLLYGSGLRLLECLRLRVKDVDLQYLHITVREPKGGKERKTMLPVSLTPALREHLENVRQRHQHDLAAGFGAVYLPGALERKLPGASREWAWQYVFPAERRSIDPGTGKLYVVWSDNRFTGTVNQIVITTSTDGGKTWSTPAVISKATGMELAHDPAEFKRLAMI